MTKPEDRPNLSIEDYNLLVEHARDLDRVSRQKTDMLNKQRETIAKLQKENKNYKARIEAIKQACS